MPRVAITGFWAACAGRHRSPRFWNARTPSWEGEIGGAASQPQELLPALRAVLRDAGLLSPESDAPLASAARTAVCFGTSKSDFTSWATPGEAPNAMSFCDANALTIAANLQAGGPCLAPVAACATGAHALALGAQLIEDGRADIAICGANEPPQNEFVLGGYRSLGALSKRGVMRPFDRRRDGFVPGWGAGVLVLESEAHARTRGAHLHAFLSGYSLKCDATHMTAMCPSGDTIAHAIEETLRRAGNPRVDTINAHGTATKLNDSTESRGIALALGSAVPVSSTKPLTGHLLGAAGAVEAVLCLLALRDNFVPPTLDLEAVDESLSLDFVMGTGRALELETVLSLNYGFGGHIGALLFQKAPPEA